MSHSRYASNFLHRMLLGLALLFAMTAQAQTQAQTPALAGLTVQPAAKLQSASFDAVVEAVRQTVVAAQVSGAIQQLEVKAGDRVKVGQVLLRIDDRAAAQTADAAVAQGEALRAALHLATREFERQQLLFKQQFISQAALDQAESQFKASQAQMKAQLAQLAVARTQTGLHVVRSPYAGVVAELPVAVGDMALPGRPLLTLYDPAALRVSAHLPQSAATALRPDSVLAIEIPGLPGGAKQRLTPSLVQLLPSVDAATHTMELRLDLPAGIGGVSPGMFARVWVGDRLGAELSASDSSPSSGAALWVPRTALIRRAELDALYVLDKTGKPLLRQVRLGATQGERVEVLSGLSAGERIATDPAAAARVR
ncbi:efflux RND transporter periplasmic adaptor subunit [Roseateles oligotrophus]|uniref:Efflux RND transporter periplasmic adaptor subunit n=1 Tax=Roseateles oligotrophus TaxID=1769250 RepID=A0ABT2YHV9_9BURK|nr:efflux RND transporter periplasmic adaptor subunit [Roseateles oligotrophus]MCV2369644.1 efflux RND transporter periplasmic adaptor subunit [Roseateles oligotrophus]